MRVQRVGDPFQAHRLADGRRVLSRDLTVEVEGIGTHTIRQGFDTDFSSWPRLPSMLATAATIVAAAELGWHPVIFALGALAFCAIPPAQRRSEIAGVLHDDLFRYAVLCGKKCSFIQANRLWFHTARAGKDRKTRCSRREAWFGRIGLLASYPVWVRYRSG